MRGDTFRPFGDQVAVLGAGDATDGVNCFADDVVVDFPSVAPAIERMRRAFVADEHSAPLRTDVQLTRRDAREGATVPLDVPVRCTCPLCGGRGETWTEPCPGCYGTGMSVLRHQLQVTVPAGVTHGARFHFTVTPRHNPPTRIVLHVFVDLVN